MNNRETLHRFISNCIANSKGFVCWYPSGNSDINAVVQTTEKNNTLNTPEAIDKLSGFIFAPFDISGSYKTIFLQPDHHLKGIDQIEAFNTKHPAQIHNTSENTVPLLKSTSREDYLSACKSVINRINEGEAEKVVYSKIKVNATKVSPAGMFLSLKRLYDDAFCYIFYSPDTGMWMGASPELLVTRNQTGIRTMALAGTRRFDAKLPNRKWPQKEITEQRIVTDFIRNELKTSGFINVEISAPYTSRAGAIEHIRTDFVISNTGRSDALSTLIKCLHPTPAVCGQPRQNALKIITQTENHDREYYAGFLGPVNLENSTTLFVNLRCMKILRNICQLYVGGGITADSDAEAEWNETEMKAGILEAAIKNEL